MGAFLSHLFDKAYENDVQFQVCLYCSAFALTVTRFIHGIIQMLKFKANKISNANIKQIIKWIVLVKNKYQHDRTEHKEVLFLPSELAEHF